MTNKNELVTDRDGALLAAGFINVTRLESMLDICYYNASAEIEIESPFGYTLLKAVYDSDQEKIIKYILVQ